MKIRHLATVFHGIPRRDDTSEHLLGLDGLVPGQAVALSLGELQPCRRSPAASAQAARAGLTTGSPCRRRRSQVPRRAKSLPRSSLTRRASSRSAYRLAATGSWPSFLRTGRGHMATPASLSSLDRPVTSVSDVAEHLGVTFNGANMLVSRFVDLGLLVETTGGARRRRFAYDPYISLLRVGTERPAL